MSGSFFARWWVLLLVVSVVLCSDYPATGAENVRFVPQLQLTNVKPRSLAFHPKNDDVIMLVNVGGRLDIFDIKNWSRPVKMLEIHDGIGGAGFSRDGKRIISGSFDGTVRLWDTESGQPIGEPLKAHRGAVSHVEFGAQNTRFASGGADGIVRLWTVVGSRYTSKVLKGHSESISSIAFSRDGSRVVSGARTVRFVCGTCKGERLWENQ